ncbi:MAG: hypothetical protein AT716_01855 [Vulcanisaeta sp. MG_3]|jgi:hypothetical protein|nr:MAG: hypothetical protein AT716_01855 [Vulcanisaeta sp. MG_3]
MDLIYIIRRDCIENLTNRKNLQVINMSDEGALLGVGDDEDFVNDAINNGCTVYARHYRFRIVRMGYVDAIEESIRPFDSWIENDELNLVVNPLRLTTLDLARILYGLNFDLELISETDVEFMKGS